MQPKRGRPPYPEEVTPAEAKVLELVREGLHNAEIATRLGISVNTVRYHISNLLAKAGKAERGQLRDWAPAVGRTDHARWPLAVMFLKPLGIAAAVAAVVAVFVAAALSYPRSGEPVFEGQPLAPANAPFKGAVVGELRREGAHLVLTEAVTNTPFTLTAEMNFGRFTGRTMFIMGTIDGGLLTPTGGSPVGEYSRCGGVLKESDGKVSISGGCGEMEVTGLSIEQVLAMRSEKVVITVLPCTESRAGRLAAPPIHLADEERRHSCPAGAVRAN